jgi:hypothetical protein
MILTLAAVAAAAAARIVSGPNIGCQGEPQPFDSVVLVLEL